MNKQILLIPGLTITVSKELIENGKVKFPLHEAKLIGTVIVPDPTTRVVLASSNVTDYEEVTDFAVLTPKISKDEVLSFVDKDGDMNILANVPVDELLVVKWTIVGSSSGHKITIYYPDGKEESYEQL
jgi:hypothetical protein